MNFIMKKARKSMSIIRENTPELFRDEYTEYIYDVTCFETPVDVKEPQDVIKGIERALELEAHPIFLEGISARLNQLGTSCSVNDTELMLTEIKQR